MWTLSLNLYYFEPFPQGTGLPPPFFFFAGDSRPERAQHGSYTLIQIFVLNVLGNPLKKLNDSQS